MSADCFSFWGSETYPYWGSSSMDPTGGLPSPRSSGLYPQMNISSATTGFIFQMWIRKRHFTLTLCKHNWDCITFCHFPVLHFTPPVILSHCDCHQLHYCKFLSDERLSANVPSALQRHLSGTLCQHLFWTVTLWHYLKLHLKLIFSRLYLANWLELPASASEAIAPRHSINRVLLLLFSSFLYTR